MTNYSANNGYDAKNIASLDEKYKCLICRLILKDAVQLACGHRICHLCFSRENTAVQCPECSENTLISEIKHDKGFNNEMQTLPINCNQCEWSGQLKIYQAHLEQAHHQYTCSYCNETINSLTLLNQHMEKVCPQMPIKCILQPYGCKEQILRCNLSKHYLTQIHQQILVLYILQILANTTKENQKLTWFDTHVEREMIDVSSNVTTTAATTTSVTDKYNVEQGYIKETIDILSGGIEALNADIQGLGDESLQQSLLIESNSQRLEMLKTSCEDSNATLNSYITNLGILQQDCLSLKQQVIESQSISYDGTLIWKIMNVNEKMIDAQSERQPSIYSPPFYSSPTGYKLCARLYMHGDGNARGTHMSLFFVLMRGLNDPLLQYPFKHKVTFCLFDQTNQQRHIIDSFRPDTRSSSFQKPQSNMNIASGIPKFVPLSIIQQNDNPYIKNDTMFIKVMVDFENLPKTILPYTFSLNPALPIHWQQKMIHQEMERQALLRSQQTSQISSTNNGKGTVSSQSSLNDPT